MPERPELTPDELYAAYAIDRVAERLMIHPETVLYSSGREAYPASARQLTGLVLKEGTDMSYHEIATALGYQNHTPIFHGIRHMRKHLGGEESAREKVARLMENVESNRGQAEKDAIEALGREVAQAEEIVSTVIDHYGISRDQFLNTDVHAGAEPRQFASLILREETALTYKQIAPLIGFARASAVHNAERAARKRLGNEASVHSTIDAVLGRDGISRSQDTPGGI